MHKASPHYDTDYVAWLEQQATALRARRWSDVDAKNLAEEIDDLGKSQRREFRSRLKVLLQHLLKLKHQPGRRPEAGAPPYGTSDLRSRNSLRTARACGRSSLRLSRECIRPPGRMPPMIRDWRSRPSLATAHARSKRS